MPQPPAALAKVSARLPLKHPIIAVRIISVGFAFPSAGRF